MIYLALTAESRRVKIGFTAGPARVRLAKMQTDNHERLTIIRWLEGDESTETAIQARYGHLRLRGDWFTFCETMMGDLGVPEIAGVAPLSPAPLTQRDADLHASAIRAAGGRTYVAGALRIPVETVKSWSGRGIPARYWHKVVALAAASMPGLTIDALERAHPTPASAP